MFMLGMCYNCITVCVGAVTSVCRYYFFSTGCQDKRSQRAQISKFLSLIPFYTNIFHLLGETCYFHPFSLSGLESFKNTSYTDNSNKDHNVLISACSCL